MVYSDGALMTTSLRKTWQRILRCKGTRASCPEGSAIYKIRKNINWALAAEKRKTKPGASPAVGKRGRPPKRGLGRAGAKVSGANV